MKILSPSGKHLQSSTEVHIIDDFSHSCFEYKSKKSMSVISVEKCIGLMVDITLGSLSKVYSMGELFTVMQVSGGI